MKEDLGGTAVGMRIGQALSLGSEWQIAPVVRTARRTPGFEAFARLAILLPLGGRPRPRQLLIEPFGELSERGGGAAQLPILFQYLIQL